MLAVRMVRQFGYAAAVGLALAAAMPTGARAVDATALGDASPKRKLSSEPETRAAMDAIRRRVINVHSLITHRRMPIAGAAQFSRDTTTDVSRIWQVRSAMDVNTDPLAPLLHKIEAGAAAIAHPTPERGQVDGLVDVVSALEEYGTVFDHPGWPRLQQQ